MIQTLKTEVNVVDDYWVCPHCGSYLDPWEACDCWKPPATEPAIDPRITELLQLWRAEVLRGKG